jgi:hypothetical protein
MRQNRFATSPSYSLYTAPPEPRVKATLTGGCTGVDSCPAGRSIFLSRRLAATSVWTPEPSEQGPEGLDFPLRLCWEITDKADDPLGIFLARDAEQFIPFGDTRTLDG